MRLQPQGLYVHQPVLRMAEDARSLRLSIRDLATICENHPHAVAPLHSLLQVEPADDAAEIGRRIGGALYALAKERGWNVDTPRPLSDLTDQHPEMMALALVIQPFAGSFGAHLTAPRSANAVLGVRTTPLAPAAIDLGAAIGPLAASSAKLRHYARSISPEGDPWETVADLLFELRETSPADFIARHGDMGRLFVGELAQAQHKPAPEPPNWDAMASLISSLYHRHGERARGLIDELVRRDELIPKRIPELDLVAAATPEDHFAGTGIAGIQHLLPSIVPLIEAFVRRGAKASDIWLLAKDYTNNPLVIAYLRTLGVHVMDATEEVDGTHHVQHARARDIASFVRAAGPALASCTTELILDDGAALIEHLNQPTSRRRAVELTTKGHNRLLELVLSFPAISIARAPNKIDEGEVIGVDLAGGLCREIRWQRGKLEREQVLAVGLGTVGSNFLAELDRQQLSPLGFDLDDGKRQAAQSKVPAARIFSTLEDGLREAAYAVLITGTGPMDPRPFVAHGVQVGSGSSEAVELDENRFFELALLNAPLNGMRPLNFVRTGHETLSHRQIGLTRATFFAACAQVVGETEAKRSELETTPALEAAAALWKASGKDTPRPRAGAPAPPKSHAGVHPTHSEWMRFFLEGSLSEEAPVMVRPAPSAVNFAPQPYLYFHQGAWHLVDTRDGESQRLRLGVEWNDHQTQLLVMADSGPHSSALLRPTHDGSQLITIDPSGRASSPMLLGRPAGVSTRHQQAEPHVRFAWIFERQDTIEVVSGGKQPRVHRFERADARPSIYAAVGEDALLQVTSEPAVYLYSLDGDVRRLNNHGLNQIIGLSSPSNRPEESASVFLVGREPTGRTAVIRFDSADSMARIVLPEGATYRRVDVFTGQTPAVVFELEGRLESLEIPAQNAQSLSSLQMAQSSGA